MNPKPNLQKVKFLPESIKSCVKSQTSHLYCREKFYGVCAEKPTEKNESGDETYSDELVQRNIEPF